MDRTRRTLLKAISAAPVAAFSQGLASSATSTNAPVIAGGKMYIRDQDTLFCYDVKAP